VQCLCTCCVFSCENKLDRFATTGIASHHTSFLQGRHFLEGEATIGLPSYRGVTKRKRRRTIGLPSYWDNFPEGEGNHRASLLQVSHFPEGEGNHRTSILQGCHFPEGEGNHHISLLQAGHFPDGKGNHHTSILQAVTSQGREEKWGRKCEGQQKWTWDIKPSKS